MKTHDMYEVIKSIIPNAENICHGCRSSTADIRYHIITDKSVSGVYDACVSFNFHNNVVRCKYFDAENSAGKEISLDLRDPNFIEKAQEFFKEQRKREDWR